jgi:hypothetical protein
MTTTGSPSSSSTGEHSTAIISCAVRTGSEYDMITNVKNELKGVAENTSLYTEHINNDIFVGNTQGLMHARQSRERDMFESRLSRNEQEMAEVKRELSSAKHELISAKSRIINIEESLGYYKVLRNRFISTFKRDKLFNATLADQCLIGDGNVWAHEGNASRDAELYDSVGGRTDVAIYETLYGLHPAVVKTLSKSV